LLIIDTNVFIAGIISSQDNSPVTRIVDAMLSAELIYVLSPALLGEYREVLLRPRLCRLHGLSEPEIDQLLTEITLNAVWNEPLPGAQAPDTGDNHLWDLLKHNASAILVTGDQLLLNNPPSGSSVISPATCVNKLMC
jgi:putative PIN family toxin of toxin-antitoxin system